MRRRATAAAAGILFLTGAVFGQEQPKRDWHRQWIVSALALTAAQVLDGWSSRGAAEMNPLMKNAQGHFSVGRAFAWKSAASGSVVGVEALLIRKNHGAAKGSAILNFATAGAVAGIAFRNTRVP
jgi:hypothetical protein